MVTRTRRSLLMRPGMPLVMRTTVACAVTRRGIGVYSRTRLSRLHSRQRGDRYRLELPSGGSVMGGLTGQTYDTWFRNCGIAQGQPMSGLYNSGATPAQRRLCCGNHGWT